MPTPPPADDRTDDARPTPPAGAKPQETQQAEEWGERHDAAKATARGGKTDGPVPGAEPDRQ